MESKRILLAEDEPTYYTVLSKALTDQGYSVTCATNGKEALDILTNNHFDLILLDLIMPQKNGFEVLEALQKVPKEQQTPILILSNLGQPDELRRSMSLGAADHIIKANLSLSEVVDKVKMYLDHS